MKACRPLCLYAAAMIAATAGYAHGFMIIPNYVNPDGWTDDQKAVINLAISNWTSRISMGGANNQQFTMNFYQYAGGTAPGSNLGSYELDGTVPTSMPYSPGLDHRIFLNADYFPIEYYGLTPPTATSGYDMLTLISHELGHALGFLTGYYLDSGRDRFASHNPAGVFDPGGLNVPMYDDTHVNLPDDLMYYSLQPGVRKAITTLDVQMLSLAYGYTALPVPEPASLGILAIGLPLLLVRRRQA